MEQIKRLFPSVFGYSTRKTTHSDRVKWHQMEENYQRRLGLEIFGEWAKGTTEIKNVTAAIEANTRAIEELTENTGEIKGSIGELKEIVGQLKIETVEGLSSLKSRETDNAAAMAENIAELTSVVAQLKSMSSKSTRRQVSSDRIVRAEKKLTHELSGLMVAVGLPVSVLIGFLLL